MFRAYAPFLIGISKEVREMLGCQRSVAAATTFRQTTALGTGLDLAHAPVLIRDKAFGTSARVMPSGTIAIEVDAAPRGLSSRVIAGKVSHKTTSTASEQHRRSAQ